MSFHIVILGAGISGLSTAWFIKQFLGDRVKLSILEKNKYPGGWIQTFQEYSFLFEQGPHSYRSQGNGWETLSLIEELGLQNEVLKPHSSVNKRYLFDGQSLKKMPSSFWSVPFNTLTKGWLKALLSDLLSPKSEIEDENIYQFFLRRLGHQWTENLIDPFVLGIYAADIHSLSVKSCFPRFHEWEQKYGSLIKGVWHQQLTSFPKTPFIELMRRIPLFSFKNGMQTLPNALAKELKEHLFLDNGIERIDLETSSLLIHQANGKKLKADYVISTLPSFVLATLLKQSVELSDLLNQLDYTTIQVAQIGFNRKVLPLQGFGYLNPTKNLSNILGCIWDSSIFPEQDQGKEQTRLTMMLREKDCDEGKVLAKKDLENIVSQGLHSHLGIAIEPKIFRINEMMQAIPRFPVGYTNLQQKVNILCQTLYPRLILSGTAWSGVSINDCVAHAKKLAKKLKSEVETVTGS